MGNIRRFIGDEDTFEWESQTIDEYGEAHGAKDACIKWIIGPLEHAPHFAIRYVEIQSGGYSTLETHEHDHGVIVLKGKGSVLHQDQEEAISYGDAIYIPPNEIHQFRNIGDEPLGFLCVIPNKELLKELTTLRNAISKKGG